MAQGKGLGKDSHQKAEKSAELLAIFMWPGRQNLVVGSCHDTQDLRGQDPIVKGGTQEQT